MPKDRSNDEYAAANNKHGPGKTNMNGIGLTANSCLTQVSQRKKVPLDTVDEVLAKAIDELLDLIGFKVWVAYGADEVNNEFLSLGRPMSEVK